MSLRRGFALALVMRL